jgi:hypothetical protein
MVMAAMAVMAALRIVDRTCQASACSRCEVDRPCTIEFFFLNDMLRRSWGALPASRNHDRVNHRRQNRCSPATANERSERIKKIPLHLRASPTAQMRDSALQFLELIIHLPVHGLIIHLPVHGSSVCKCV